MPVTNYISVHMALLHVMMIIVNHSQSRLNIHCMATIYYYHLLLIKFLDLYLYKLPSLYMHDHVSYVTLVWVYKSTHSILFVHQYYEDDTF